MKNVTPAMAAHLKQDVTTLTTCWRILRADGVEFGFTEHDHDLEYNGLTYKSNGGFNKSAIKNSATFSVDNLEVTGFLSDDTIDDTELRNGAFDYAEVEIFLVNYRDLSMGTIKMRYGYFGEVKTAPSGAFVVELRGLVQLLAQKVGEVYTPECRADFGDKRCKVETLPGERNGNKRYYTGQRMVTDISQVATPPVSVPLKNLNFDYDTGPNQDWGLANSASIVASTLSVRPFSGPFLGRTRALDQLFGNLNVSTTLVTGPITDAVLNTGEVKLRCKFKLNAIEEGQVPKMRVDFRTGQFGQSVQNAVYDFAKLTPPKSWVDREMVLDIPAGARFAQVYIFVGSVPTNGLVDMGIDSVTLDIVRPGAATDFRAFGGVEWQCTTPGVTAADAPAFPAVLGTTVTDGEVEWLCVQPKHMFLDTILTDATNSSTLKLSTLDLPDDWFNWGVLKILTGENAGIAIEPATWDADSKTIVLAMPLPHKTLAGTFVQLTTGCDKSRTVCKVKFQNLLNFRGEPDVPGINRYFKVAGVE